MLAMPYPQLRNIEKQMILIFIAITVNTHQLSANNKFPTQLLTEIKYRRNYNMNA